MELERVNAPLTVAGRLRSIAPLVRSVRKDDIIRQRHLPNGFLKTQDTSTFAESRVSNKFNTSRQSNNHFRVCGIQYQTTPDSYLTS